MKLIATFKGIAHLWQLDYVYVKGWRNGFYRYENSKLHLLIGEELESFTIYKDNLIYRLVNDVSTIYLLKDDGSKHSLIHRDNESLSISENALIDNELCIVFTETGNFIPEGMYLIGSDLNPRKINITNIYALKAGHFYFNKNDSEVISYYEDHTVNYKIDISTFGRNIKKHRDSDEILSDTPNVIDGELFSDKGLLFVPLKGGQLLALNVSDGSKAWILEHEISGAYEMSDDLIYKKDGKQIYEIEAATGIVIRQKRFKEDNALTDFYASGPIRVYQDIIVLADVLSGKICMLDRADLNVREFFTINQKLPFNKNTIIWHEGNLHILDLENTLHIYGEA